MTQLGFQEFREEQPRRRRLGWVADADPEKLRYYQREASDTVRARWLSGVPHTLVVMATGLGKTRVAAHLAKHTTGRVLLLVHRDELADQAAEELALMTGEVVDIEKAERVARLTTRLVVGSVQTLDGRRLERWPRDHFEVVVVDEAHHYVARTYRLPLDHFESACRVGFTATPDRGDKRSLRPVFPDSCFVFDILQGIEAGYLVPIDGKLADVEIDLSEVKVVKGDLVAGQVDDAMVRHVEGIVQALLKHYPDRRGPLFFPGVRTAELAAARLNAIKPGCAAFIHGGTDRDERRAIVKAFKRGKYQWLCNCDVATEGFDDPTSNLVGIFRATKSRGKFAQMAGRGGRVLPGIVDHLPLKEQAEERRGMIAASAKPECVLFYIGDASGVHSLVTPEDVLGGSMAPAVVKRAKAKAKAAKDRTSVLDNLIQARRELAELAKATKSGNLQTKIARFDPFRVMQLEINDQERHSLEYGHKPMLAWQQDYLRSQSVPQAHIQDLSRRAAQRLVDELRLRHSKGLASYRQLHELQRFGFQRRDITKYQASRGIAYLIETNYGRREKVDHARLTSIVTGETNAQTRRRRLGA